MTGDDESIPGLVELRRAQVGTTSHTSTEDLVRAAARADRATVHPLVLAALAVLALELVAFSIYDLLGLEGADTHDSRHLGSFNLAYAVAIATVIHRPARARVILPVAVVLGVALAITAVVDVASGEVPLIGEATHLAELISIPLIWTIATGRARTRR